MIVTIDERLGQQVFQDIRISRFAADPWKLFQNRRLLKQVIIRVLEEESFPRELNIIASISELAVPLAVNLAHELSGRGLFSGSLLRLDPFGLQNDNIWCPPLGKDLVTAKRVFLVDELLGTGKHALKSITDLINAGAQPVGLLALLDNTAEPDEGRELDRLASQVSPIYRVTYPRRISYTSRARYAILDAIGW